MYGNHLIAVWLHSLVLLLWAIPSCSWNDNHVSFLSCLSIVFLLFHYFHHVLSVSVGFFCTRWLSPSMFASVSVCICVCLSIALPFFILSLCDSVSIGMSVCLSVSRDLYPSVSHYLSFSVSLFYCFSSYVYISIHSLQIFTVRSYLENLC